MRDDDRKSKLRDVLFHALSSAPGLHKIDRVELRKQIARAVDVLADSIARIPSELATAMPGVDPDALRVLSDWLIDPTPDTHAAVERLLAAEQAIELADQQQMELEIEQSVRSSLDEIFKDPPPNPYDINQRVTR